MIVSPQPMVCPRTRSLPPSRGGGLVRPLLRPAQAVGEDSAPRRVRAARPRPGQACDSSAGGEIQRRRRVLGAPGTLKLRDDFFGGCAWPRWRVETTTSTRRTWSGRVAFQANIASRRDVAGGAWIAQTKRRDVDKAARARRAGFSCRDRRAAIRGSRGTVDAGDAIDTIDARPLARADDVRATVAVVPVTSVDLMEWRRPGS